VRHDTLFTNVALTADNEPWWEGLEGQPAIDWQGRPYDPASGPAAQPNSRFTVAASQNPAYSRAADDPRGVPISAVIFGGRRRELTPLVYEARSWAHGVLTGASVASETTAAASGQVGIVRRDPMAMKPFCGYNYGDYWAHWLKVGAGLKNPPRIFHVNWFRQNAAGSYLWPGYGDNLRVLAWILDRCAGRASAIEEPIGRLPAPGDINTAGLDISAATLAVCRHRCWLNSTTSYAAWTAEASRRLRRLQLSSQMKWIVKGESRSGIRPRPIRPSPLIGMLSRRTKASSSPLICTKVPLVL
jgi:phosphoenolpyruvate carboxykinase (GTP)